MRLELWWFFDTWWNRLAFWGEQNRGRHWDRSLLSPARPGVTRVIPNWDHTLWLRQYWDKAGSLHSEVINFGDVDLSAALRELGAMRRSR